MTSEGEHPEGRDWVALTLAIGVCTAFNLITVAVLIAAWYRGNETGDYSLSENATQVLIAGFGGFIGILGGYVGGRAVERAHQRSQTTSTTFVTDDAATITTHPPGSPLPGEDDPDASA